MTGDSWKRVLALHVTATGFAYCLFESPGVLHDWGTKSVSRGCKNKHSVAALEHLLVRFDPHVICLEDVSHPTSKRGGRVRALHRQIELLADRGSVEVYTYSWPLVFAEFKRGNPKTRHDLAAQVAAMIPSLTRRLPPKRKSWKPQDPRQALFDAAALGITFYAVT